MVKLKWKCHFCDFSLNMSTFLSYQMMKVRRMLTEILLEVTDSEVYDIARSVYNKARAKSSKGRSIKRYRELKGYEFSLTIICYYKLYRFVFKMLPAAEHFQVRHLYVILLWLILKILFFIAFQCFFYQQFLRCACEVILKLYMLCYNFCQETNKNIFRNFGFILFL